MLGEEGQYKVGRGVVKESFILILHSAKISKTEKSVVEILTCYLQYGDKYQKESTKSAENCCQGEAGNGEGRKESRGLLFFLSLVNLFD